MRSHTREFKEEISKFGRQIKGKIIYYKEYNIITESEDNILSENDLYLISESANYDDPIEINEEDIFSMSIIKNGNLLQSLMKEFDFETKDELNIGSVVNPYFGLLVDNEYEYLDYGNYIINSKEYNVDTDTWSYICYDKMLFSMIKYKGLKNIEFPITIKQFINKLCEKVGLEFEDSDFVNHDQIISEDVYKNKNVTIRDIFDEISKIVAGNLLINDDDKLEVGYIKNTVGKNLFDLEKYYENCIATRCTKQLVNNGIKITFTAGNDSWLGDTLLSTDTPSQAILDRIKKESVEVKPNTKYTLSISSTPKCYISYLDEDYNGLSSSYIRMPSSYTQTSYTFTTPNNTKYVLFRFGIQNNNYTEWTFSNIQLEEGNNATEYEEYGLDKINELYLKDTNVKTSDKIGVINSVAIHNTENDLQYVSEDTESIKANGLTRITITDNLLALNGDTQDIADNILNKLNGLYYYQNDLTTTGVCYYDFLDLFNVEAREETYQCLLLNNEITITQGIEEHIFTENLEEKETNTTEYVTSVMSNKKVSFKINEQEGKIESKVEKDGVISAINQSEEEIQIQANKVSLEGKEINLTSDNVIIESTNFSVDKEGNMSCNNATANNLNVNGGQINLVANSYSDERFVLTYSSGSYNYKNGISPVGMIVYNRSNPNYYSYYESNGFNATHDNNYIECYADRINLYKNNSSTIRISTDDGNITCVSLTQTSRKENKKNFEKLYNAKDILKHVDIYKYNFKDEDDNIKKSIGFVIGDDFNYSEEITSTNNDGANIYSMVSVLWQVVKEQQEEIEELKEMIKNGKY